MSPGEMNGMYIWCLFSLRITHFCNLQERVWTNTKICCNSSPSFDLPYSPGKKVSNRSCRFVMSFYHFNQFYEFHRILIILHMPYHYFRHHHFHHPLLFLIFFSDFTPDLKQTLSRNRFTTDCLQSSRPFLSFNHRAALNYIMHIVSIFNSLSTIEIDCPRAFDTLKFGPFDFIVCLLAFIIVNLLCNLCW